MIHLDLTPGEQVLLREMLEAQLSDLRMELAGTDRLAYRDILRTHNAVLQKVLDSLPTAQAAANQAP
jgi:hypothetical protein